MMPYRLISDELAIYCPECARRWPGWPMGAYLVCGYCKCKFCPEPTLRSHALGFKAGYEAAQVEEKEIR